MSLSSTFWTRGQYTVIGLTLLMMRIIQKLKIGGENEHEYLPNGEKRYFKNLISHKNDIKQDAKKMEIFQMVLCIIEHYFQDQIQSTEQDIWEDIYGKILINAIALEHENNGSKIIFGSGVYLGASALDHSCCPNAIWYSINNKELIIKTIEKVEHYSEIRITYLPNLYESTNQRREQLLKLYYFLCQCSTCLDFASNSMKSSMKCLNCQYGCVPLQSGICSDCDSEMDTFAINKSKKLKSEIHQAIHDVDVKNFESRRIFDNLYDQSKVWLHSYDQDFMELLHNVWNNYLDQQNYQNDQKGLEIAQLMFTNFCQTVPQYFPRIGLRRITLANLCCSLNLFGDALEHVRLAEKCVKICYGNDLAHLEECQRIRRKIGFVQLSR